MIVMELMPLGDLRAFMLRHESILRQTSLCWMYCWQVAQAMEYLEELNCVHRDIAARNILVQDPQTVKV